MSRPQYGMDGVLYLGDTVIVSASTLPGATVPVIGVVDVTNNGDASSFDTSDRDSVIGTDGRGKPKFSIDFNIQNKSEAAAQIAIFRAAFANKTELCMAEMDRPISVIGAEGLVANFQVHKFNRGEPLEGRQTYDITIKPSSFPWWKSVSA